jgi:hypothetical protein
MGFLDSLGIEFIDDDAVDDVAEEILQTQPEESNTKGPSQTAVKSSGSKLSSYTKEDLIVFMMLLVFGAAGGFAYHKLLSKDKSQPLCLLPHYPMGSMCTHTENKHEEKIKEVKHSKAVEKSHKHKSSLRHGYYEDEHGDLVLDPPTVRTNWVIDFGVDGSIMDAYQIPDSDQVL